MMTSRRSIGEGLRLSNDDLTRGDAVLHIIMRCSFLLSISYTEYVDAGSASSMSPSERLGRG